MFWTKNFFSLVFVFLLFPFCIKSQTINNSDLNGVIPNLPTGWQRVLATDPISLASNPGITDTPDLTDISGPNAPAGILGQPYSGLTFVSALRGKFPGAPYTPPNAEFHEGIMQTVNGFNPGQSYTIHFYQTVVKQDRYLDRSGSWAVYFDNTLAGVSAVSYSALAFNDVNLIWDKRSITFTATANTHTLKFMAEDDDANIMVSLIDTAGALRMGIDSIWITTCNFTVNLGPDVNSCQPNISLLLDATTPNATYLWQNNSTNPTFNVSSPGTYWVTVTANGCSATDSISIVLNQNITSSQSPSICSGSSFSLPGGSVVSSAGIYLDTLTAANGCDSIITTNLSVVPFVSTIQSPVICAGNTFVLPGGGFISVAGTYKDTLTSAAGCDSIITTNLSVTPASNTNLSPSICSGQNYTLPGGSIVNVSGTYIDTLNSVSGCDSIITILLSVVQSISTIQNSVICSGSTYTLPGGINTGVAGTYIDTLSSSGGCDSIITTNLYVIAASTGSQNPTICSGSFYVLPNGSQISISGTYTDTLTSSAGCDSIVTITLTVNPGPVVSTSGNITIQAGQSANISATGGLVYVWTPNTNLSSATGASVTASPNQTTTYCVNVTDINGCTNSACLTITVEENPCDLNLLEDVPNAFSPNGDNVNDVFCLPAGKAGLQGWNNCIREFSVIIYDRWGEKVFESKDPNFCWDGQFRGVVMDSQVFVYYIKAKYTGLDKPVVKKGNISLLK